MNRRGFLKGFLAVPAVLATVPAPQPEPLVLSSPQIREGKSFTIYGLNGGELARIVSKQVMRDLHSATRVR